MACWRPLEQPTRGAQFILVYANLTGAVESPARSVRMCVCGPPDGLERTIPYEAARLEGLRSESSKRRWQTPASVPVSIRPATA